MQHPGTNDGSSSPHWREREQIASAPVLLMTGISLSENPGILASEGISPHMFGMMVMETCQRS